jgi:hypothetical protein
MPTRTFFLKLSCNRTQNQLLDGVQTSKANILPLVWVARLLDGVLTSLLLMIHTQNKMQSWVGPMFSCQLGSGFSLVLFSD